jgi:exodeoxyribonuclease V beta subunit
VSEPEQPSLFDALGEPEPPVAPTKAARRTPARPAADVPEQPTLGEAPPSSDDPVPSAPGPTAAETAAAARDAPGGGQVPVRETIEASGAPDPRPSADDAAGHPPATPAGVTDVVAAPPATDAPFSDGPPPLDPGDMGEAVLSFVAAPDAATASAPPPTPPRSARPKPSAAPSRQEELGAAVFGIDQPLPRGVAVLEASAGTGKTFTIAGLAARYVAEGLPLEQLLVVTFTRMATSELRDRVRDRLVRSERVLAAWLASTAGADDRADAPVADLARRRTDDAIPDDDDAPAGLVLDDVERVLVDAPRATVEDRRRRLARAVADFDAATLTTIHSFCQEALDSLGFLGDVERGFTLVEDPSDLVEQVVGDLYLRRFHVRRAADPSGSWPPLDRDEARRIVRAAVEHPAAVIVPGPDSPDPRAAMRARLAQAARDELDRRKREASILTYDDLLTRLRDALRGPGGEDVAARLRARHRVVLVDEFQDTDPIQWEIMRRAFADEDGPSVAGSPAAARDPSRTSVEVEAARESSRGSRIARALVLIGDPKQAIYAFRGADVYAYLDAARIAERRTLRTNHRSDGPLLRALERLFRAARLGHEEIVFRPVDPAPHHDRARLRGAGSSPLQVRVLDRETVERTRTGFAGAPASREAVAKDLAADVVALLESGATLEEQDGAERPVRPGDVAVLVRTNLDAERIRAALQAVDVPAVIAGAGSVFATPAGRDWLTLLEALERPNAPTRARAVALTPFLGWSLQQVALATDAEWERVHERLHRWAATLRDAGVAALLQQLTVGERLPGRVLGQDDGERTLTDLRHIGQQLHAAATDDHLGIAALVVWLRRRIAEAGREGDEERTRRLESDAAAVQVLTIHRSKGLEFPVVYCPTLWESGRVDERPHPILFHDPDQGWRYTLDVSMQSGADQTPPGRREAIELRGEELRLAYVALTRARHRAVTWWCGAFPARDAPLSRLAFDQAPDGDVPTTGRRTPTDSDARSRFAALAPRGEDGAPPLIEVVSVRAPDLPRRWQAGAEHHDALEAARFDRTLDDAWGRSSYSSIVAAAHDAPQVGSEPELGLMDDEGVVPAEDAAELLVDDGPGAAGPLDPREVVSPMADLPGGRHVGTLVHDVLEAADFAAPDLEAELAEHVGRAIDRRRVDVGDPDALVASLAGVLRTPLGPLVDDRSLSTLRRGDRLDELTFELPLVGGEDPTGALRPAAIAALLREHVPPGDPLEGYADRLDDPLLATTLRGHLTGSIDLALRLATDLSGPVEDHAGAGRPRYAIVDYKTNRLGEPDRPPTAWDHRPAVLRAEMHRTHYALQGLLYSAALHRFLRWRDPGYDPDRDLAGVLYLFVRGMSGPDTPRVDGVPCGVWSWRPPAGLVPALSDLLDEAAA